MRVLIDTNILIDFYGKRPEYYDAAEKIIELCTKQNITGCIAAHSVTNAFYILRKDIPLEIRRNTLKDLCMIIEVIGIDSHKLISALSNSEFSDVEDCLQTECAKQFSADYIITRNIKDFEHSPVPAITPDEFLIRWSAGGRQ
ncbi:PIN domain-containing protein [Ruminococcus sp. HUN007]|uniref:type II toxin-antitoxin system VapC family toxin n=1 Tax=Ruminococcus sp. HUN007 TaxID=1514668 RepID=UPI0005D21867|nr:PIN domain-containing protein [Ruminococcus sp. HUN007]